MAAIILAAGRSSRMGSHKLAAALQGTTNSELGPRRRLREPGRSVIVIIGHEAEQVDAALRAERWFLAIHNPWYVEGMSTSLRIGLAATPKDVDGAIILLGDQPLMTAEIINAMIAESAREPDAIIAASYEGRRGNPVLFPRQYFAELDTITGDEGGRSVLTRHPEQCGWWKLTTRWRDSMWTRQRSIRRCSPSR